ncbi:uncharacterized protein [Haliotis asinina]|uniref:uncharacterized protein n=1 Tax=Haliotis asinina TaxID=109174 RepID=UPI0035326692
MGKVYLIVFYIFSSCFHCFGEITSCEKISACSCESEDGIVDLSPLAHNGNPRFLDVQSETGDKVSWNPCLPFTEGNCTDVAVCQFRHIAQKEYYSLGNQDSAAFSVVDGSLRLSYSAFTRGPTGVGFRSTSITLICDNSQNPGILTSKGEVPVGSGHFEMTLRSFAACAAIKPGLGATDDTTIKIVSIQTITPKPITIGPPPTTPSNIVPMTPLADISGLQSLLVGQVVLLVFIMILMLAIVLMYAYQLYLQRVVSRRSYENL